MLACALYANKVQSDADRERAETLRRYGGEVTTLVTANRVIEAGETIMASDVEERDWISTLAPDGALRATDDVVGKRVSVPIAAHAPVCEINMRESSEMAEVPSGHIAVTVPLDDRTGVSASTPEGARLIAYQLREEGTRLICDKALVLAVAGAGSGSLGQAAITLAVPTKSATDILLAEATGDLRLVMPAHDVGEAPQDPARVVEVKAETPAGEQTQQPEGEQTQQPAEDEKKEGSENGR